MCLNLSKQINNKINTKKSQIEVELEKVVSNTTVIKSHAVTKQNTKSSLDIDSQTQATHTIDKSLEITNINPLALTHQITSTDVTAESFPKNSLALTHKITSEDVTAESFSKNSSKPNIIDIKSEPNTENMCFYAGCYCKQYIESKSKWRKGKCNTCDHDKFYHNNDNNNDNNKIETTEKPISNMRNSPLKIINVKSNSMSLKLMDYDSGKIRTPTADFTTNEKENNNNNNNNNNNKNYEQMICMQSGCYCKNFKASKSKWRSGKCNTCDHEKKYHKRQQ